MKKMFFCLWILLFFSCSPKTSVTYDMAIRNGQIIDLETGEITKADLFISEGRIQKIIDFNDKPSFEAKESLDATGKFILPGFWDNHVHFRGGDSLITVNRNFLKLYIANGITTVRDAGGDLTASVMEWKQQMAKGELIGPTIFTSGPKIDGPDATWAGSLEVENKADISNALDSLEQLKVDFVKLYDSQISGENYLKTIAEAEKRGLITSGHMPFTVTLNETVDAGIDAVEHLYYVMKGCSDIENEITQKLRNGDIGFWDAMPLLQQSYTDSTAQKTFKNLIDKGVYVVPTLHIGKVLSYLDEIEHARDSYLKYMGEGIIKTYEGRVEGALNASKKARSDRKKLDKFFGELAKSLDDAGVQLLAGSDSGAFNSYVYPGISLHQELEQMVANGISPLNALRTSAYNGSKFLKQDTDLGTIEPGKIADLVLLDANPLKDISNSQKVYLVIKGSRVFNKQRLRKMLESAVME